MKFLYPVDFTHCELQNVTWQNLATAPSTPAAGWVYYDTSDNTFRGWNGSTWIDLSSIGGGGSVTAVSVVSANGFAGSVANASTTPAITISTTVNGIMKGSAGAVSAAVAGTDYASPTNGTNGQLLVSDGAGGFGTPLTVSTDGTMSGNSDSNISTQKAVKTYVDGLVSRAMHFKGSINASANPNYPAATIGDAYVISNAGNIGGAIGPSVDVGDMIVATATNAGGTQASVGASWDIIEHNLVGALLAANNLSDLTNVATARTNLGLLALATLGVGAGLTTSGSNLTVDTTVVARKYSSTIGNGSLTTIAVTHNLGTQDVIVSVRYATTNAVVYCDVVANSTTQVTLSFATAPASNSLRVTVMG